METKILVKKAKTGDKDALVELIMKEKSNYYKLAFLYLKNKEDSLDAMEDMIVILYENIYKLKKNDSFYSWSKTILVNCCKKIIKQRKKTVSIDSIKEQSYKENYEQRENKILLEKYLSQLGEKYQEVIKLRYFLDLEYKVIAEILKIPLGTVKSRISYGLNKLQAKIGGENIE
ncbi:sigma-70 family RNA polymerase sigma factor [Clostridium sp. D2Q-11]|uniref:Sigma-70 family RNA polymerase sigma factor n=1 Tax=Anaeromonas frigoriresistens TaxID=2683708 RepID=A0A942UZP7_9FIRM|nr:sigma-70 family RNA polymerase sigma factor [Anaeromonas frigoriresistens]MBS4538527.1 sigma-70 family RNA polymerase sigma factor [Anaeromonas frigoriresistens]